MSSKYNHCKLRVASLDSTPSRFIVVVLLGLRPIDFVFRIVILDWLTTKARDLSMASC